MLNRNMKLLRTANDMTQEQVAGFLNLSTGKFEEVMLIRTSQDLENFQNEYGITGTIKKIY